MKYPLETPTENERTCTHSRIREENEESGGKQDRKMKRPAKNVFTVFLEANVPMRIPRFKHKRHVIKTDRIVVGRFLSWLAICYINENFRVIDTVISTRLYKGQGLYKSPCVLSLRPQPSLRSQITPIHKISHRASV